MAFFAKNYTAFQANSHNETLSIGAMRVSNEDCSPARIHGCDATQLQPGFAL
jgi:hypothetical protein